MDSMAPALEEISAFAFVDISIRMYYYQNVIFIIIIMIVCIGRCACRDFPSKGIVAFF